MHHRLQPHSTARTGVHKVKFGSYIFEKYMFYLWITQGTMRISSIYLNLQLTFINFFVLLDQCSILPSRMALTLLKLLSAHVLQQKPPLTLLTLHVSNTQNSINPIRPVKFPFQFQLKASQYQYSEQHFMNQPYWFSGTNMFIKVSCRFKKIDKRGIFPCLIHKWNMRHTLWKAYTYMHTCTSIHVHAYIHAYMHTCIHECWYI